jgi:hypothetical protein
LQLLGFFKASLLALLHARTEVTVFRSTTIIAGQFDTYKLCSSRSRGLQMRFKPNVRQQFGQSVTGRCQIVAGWR